MKEKKGMKVKAIMTKDPITVGVNDGIAKAIALLLEFGIRHLPVIENSELAGIVSDRDIFSANSEEYEEKRSSLKVSDVMSCDVFTVDPESEVRDAIKLMLAQGVSALPVTDQSGRKLYGILTHSDILEDAVALY